MKTFTITFQVADDTDIQAIVDNMTDNLNQEQVYVSHTIDLDDGQDDRESFGIAMDEGR